MKRKYRKRLKQLSMNCLSYFLSIGIFLGVFKFNPIYAEGSDTARTGVLKQHIKKFFIMLLSVLISIGSFIGLFSLNAIRAAAYDVTNTAQLKLASGVCYNGQNPDHPFIYTTERMGINSGTWLPTYNRGNDGAGGNVGGSTEILLKRINTGSAWSSVPLYRVSRSGGYSDDLPYVTGDATNIVSRDQIYNAINSLSGINRKISKDEADMIQKVCINGFKAGLETTGSGNSYSWDDNLRYTATQILIWEIQEGKRWSFGTADGNYRQEADTVGSNPWYWKQWWDNVVMPAASPGSTNWYYKILDMCQATSESMSVTADNSGSSATASIRKSGAGTLNAQYYDGRYELSFHITNSNLWGNQYGQFNASGVTWEPDEGSRGASLSWSGSTGYLTSTSDRPDEPISGYLKFTQKTSSGDFNNVGYMSGSTSNSWRGFIFGGNSTATVLYIRVGSTGGPTPMTVKFVNESGSPVNVDWNFQVNDTNITEFTETSSGKTFVPQYYLDHHAQANYKINITSVPSKYQMPKELTTLFYYNSGTGILKHGTGAGSTGWGSWDYGACQATFSGETITITLKEKEREPVTVKFVDGDTGQPVPVSFTQSQRKGLSILNTFEEQFKVANKSSHTWTPTEKRDQRIEITAWPDGYNMDLVTKSYNFSYANGIPEKGIYSYNNMSISNSTITIKLYKTLDLGDITIEFRDGNTGQLMEGDSFMWALESRYGNEVWSAESSYIYQPTGIGTYTITTMILDNTGQWVPTAPPTTDFYFDGENVSLPIDNPNVNAYAEGRKLTIYIYPYTDFEPLSIKFIDAETEELVDVTWSLYTIDGSVEVEHEVSHGKSFVPQFYLNYNESMAYLLELEDTEGYIAPSQQYLRFYYDGYLYEDSDEDYNGMNATIEGNTLVIRLYPVGEIPPEENPDMGLSFLTPNSDYHFSEEVISSYYLKNKNDRAYNPATSELKAVLTLEKVENGAAVTVSSNEITNVVCPGNATQLIYFKWTVPALLSTGNERWQLHTYVYDSAGNQVTESVDEVTVANKTRTDTPPNKFDLDGGKNFMPISPLTKNQDYYNSASWQQYVWENGGYVVKTYSAKLWNDEITVYPDETNPSATLEGGKDIVSRSGYGMKLRLKARVDQYEGDTEIVNAGHVTAVQYAGAYYPEQLYSMENEKHSTLELTESGFVFPVYADSTYEPGEKGDGRKHFIPMWYPDGQYTVQCRTSGCWTPAGMIDYTDEANAVIIKGSLYDDYYSSGGGN